MSTYADLDNGSLKSTNGLSKVSSLILMKCIKILYKFTGRFHLGRLLLRLLLSVGLIRQSHI